jgi:hypothetical protein
VPGSGCSAGATEGQAGGLATCKADGSGWTVQPCNDGNACTDDACNPATKNCKSVEKACNDGIPCTTDSCSNGACLFQPVPSLCNDNDKCTIDNCSAQTGCVHFPEPCDDKNNCTLDTCYPNIGCQFAPIAGCGGPPSTCFSNPAKTCNGLCGGVGSSGDCWCDTQCAKYGDCCPDQKGCGCDTASASGCGGNSLKSCQGFCGAKPSNACYCDKTCLSKGDCCPDFKACGCNK